MANPAVVICCCGPTVHAGSCLFELPAGYATLDELLAWLRGSCPRRLPWMQQIDRGVPAKSALGERISRKSRPRLEVVKGGADG